MKNILGTLLMVMVVISIISVACGTEKNEGLQAQRKGTAYIAVFDTTESTSRKTREYCSELVQKEIVRKLDYNDVFNALPVTDNTKFEKIVTEKVIPKNKPLILKSSMSPHKKKRLTKQYNKKQKEILAKIKKEITKELKKIVFSKAEYNRSDIIGIYFRIEQIKRNYPNKKIVVVINSDLIHNVSFNLANPKVTFKKIDQIIANLKKKGMPKLNVVDIYIVSIIESKDRKAFEKAKYFTTKFLKETGANLISISPDLKIR